MELQDTMDVDGSSSPIHDSAVIDDSQPSSSPVGPESGFEEQTQTPQQNLIQTSQKIANKPFRVRELFKEDIEKFNSYIDLVGVLFPEGTPSPTKVNLKDEAGPAAGPAVGGQKGGFTSRQREDFIKDVKNEGVKDLVAKQYFNELFLIYDNTHDFEHKINPKNPDDLWVPEIYLPGRTVPIRNYLQSYTGANDPIKNIESYKGAFFHNLVYGHLINGVPAKYDQLDMHWYEVGENKLTIEQDIMYDMGANFKYLGNFFNIKGNVQPKCFIDKPPRGKCEGNLCNKLSPQIYTPLKIWDPSPGSNNKYLKICENIGDACIVQNLFSFISFYKYFFEEFGMEKIWGFNKNILGLKGLNGEVISTKFNLYAPIVVVEPDSNSMVCKVYKFRRRKRDEDNGLLQIKCSDISGNIGKNYKYRSG